MSLKKTLQGIWQWWGPHTERISVLSHKHQGTDPRVGDKLLALIKEKTIQKKKMTAARMPYPSQESPTRKHEASTKRDIGPKVFTSSLVLGGGGLLGYFAACKSSLNTSLFVTHFPVPSRKSLCIRSLLLQPSPTNLSFSLQTTILKEWAYCY